MKIKQNDIVKVIAGKDKGKTGKVLRCFPMENKLMVEGVQLVKKHEKPKQQGEKGRIIEKSAKIDVSNVVFFDVESSKETKVSYNIVDNKKVRYSYKLNKEL